MSFEFWKSTRDGRWAVVSNSGRLTDAKLIRHADGTEIDRDPGPVFLNEGDKLWISGKDCAELPEAPEVIPNALATKPIEVAFRRGWFWYTGKFFTHKLRWY